MPSRDEEEDQGREGVLSASVHDLRHFATLIRGIQYTKQLKALVQLNQVGMVVTVEDARTFLGVAYIHKDVFDEYEYRSEHDNDNSQPRQPQSQDADEEGPSPAHTVFELQVNTLLDCLNVFGTAGERSAANKDKNKNKGWRKPNHHGGGSDVDSDEDNAGGSGRRGGGSSNRSGRSATAGGGGGGGGAVAGKGTAMRMSYEGSGWPLTLLIAEDASGPTATCEITTMDPEPVLDLPFDADATVMKIILKSSWLQEALSELPSSTEKLTILGYPPPPPGRAPSVNAPPRLRLRATGTYGVTEMDYPSDKEVLESCECPEAVSFSYKFKQIENMKDALKSSVKASLRLDDEGLLSLQLMIPGNNNKGKASDAFIEFRCLPLDENF